MILSSLMINGLESVKEIKKKIFNELKIPINFQILKYGSEILKENEILS